MISLKAFKKICLVIAIEHALIVASASAATITVNNPDDTDGNDMACTLREAIQSIHDLDTTSTGCARVGSFGVNDTIVFALDLANQQIRLDQDQPLEIRKELFINGLGAEQLTIDGTFNSLGGIFDIRGTVAEGKLKVRIDNLTISGGNSSTAGGFDVRYAELSLGNSIVSGNYAENAGAGFYTDNAIVHLTDSTISGNSTGGSGGAIFAYRDSTINLVNSIVSGNSADSSGGGFYILDSEVNLSLSNVSSNVAESDNFGGGGFINFFGTINLSNSTLSNNIASNGGAIFSSEGVVTIIDSTISGNTASIDGGAIFVRREGIVNFTDSTIASNTASNSGGAISVNTGGVLNLITSTISGNTAQKWGGGIYSGLGEVKVKTSTISGNTATQGGGGVFFLVNDPDTSLQIAQSTIVNNFTNDDGGGIALLGSGTVVITNSIIAGNVAADSGDEFAQFGGTFDAPGFNVLGDSSNTNAEAFGDYSPDLAGLNIIATSNGTLPTALTSILNTTLKDNGGPTKTHALVINSPAIDAGFLCSSFDQRGVKRDFGKCDIGSYEYQPMPLIFSDSFE